MYWLQLEEREFMILAVSARLANFREHGVFDIITGVYILTP